MKAIPMITRIAAACLVLTLASGAWAQVITSVSPPRVAAGTGQTITVFGGAIGHPGDLVEFPDGTTSPALAFGAGWTRVVVPATWSGNIRLRSGANGVWTNNLDLEIIYSWSATQWSPENLEWFLNQNAAPGCTVDQTRAALQAGYNAWSCASDMTMSYQGTTSSLGNSRTDGVNVQIWTNSGWSSGTVAVCSWSYVTATGDIIEFDINYNAQHYTWSCSGEADKMDVGNVGTHEMGHSIGMLDMYGDADFDKTMYGFVANGETLRRTPHFDDVLGVEFVYPRSGRPDLIAGSPPGWWGPLTPRNTADATDVSALIPSILNGNATTYINFGMTNMGLDCAAPGSLNRFYVDDVFSYWGSWSGVWGAGATFGLWRNNALTVKGGRHTLRMDYDFNEDIVEANEFNNTYSVQAVYSPYILNDLIGVTRTQPPDDGVFAAPNCDGFRFTGDWWGAVGVLPTATDDDYDMYVYDDYAGSTVGFSNDLERSFSGAGQSDFVLVNGNQVGNGFIRYAGASSYNAPTGSNALIEQSNEMGSTLVPSDAYGAEVSTGPVSINVNDILRVHEVYLEDPTLSYRFTMENLTGTANLNMSLYDAAGEYFGKWDYEVASLNFADGADEFFEYSPPVAGYYAVVIWKNDSDDAFKANSYELRVGKALSNLNATAFPTSFDYPVTVRTAGDATVSDALTSPVLNGNATSYVNRSTFSEGPYVIPAWNTQVWLDGETLVNSYDWFNTGLAYYVNLNNPALIRGGRHTLVQYVDLGSLVPETNENDNESQEQYVFSPLPTVKDVTNQRQMPPPSGFGAVPNSDGFSFAPVPTESWVIGMAPQGADDYDLEVYNDYSGSTSGFSNQIGYSGIGSRFTEFIVGHFSDANNDLYTGVTRWSATDQDGFVLDQSDTGGHRAAGVGNFTETLAANQVVDVYQALLVSGMTYIFRLERLSGVDDLQMALFPGGGIHGRSGGLVYSDDPGATVQEMAFTATGNQWYPVVVCRDDGSNLSTAVQYRLTWLEMSAAAVESETPSEFYFRGGYPNPSPGNTTMQFSLPREGPVKMTIHNVRGERVKTLISETMSAGRHERAWNGRDEEGGTVASGTYWVRLEAAGKIQTKRVTVIR